MAAPIQASTSASSGVNASNSYQGGSFAVNYGTQGVPSWLYIAGAVLVGVWFLRKGAR